MKIKKLLLYLKILAFIWRKKVCYIADILKSFKINEKTLYSNLDSWSREGYIKKDKERNNKGIKYLKIYATPKLDEIEKLMKDLISNYD